MSKIKRGLRGVWYFFWGHILGYLLYDRRNFTGKWFSGRMHGLCAEGWVWVTHDAIARFLLHENTEATFPISHRCCVIYPQNITFDPDDLNNFQSYGIYYQAIGKITIGKGTFIAPNVGLITANHDLKDPSKHLPPKPITIGQKCWIGMNSMVLSGVTLGDGTIVGAGSVVTKSFVNGHCVIAGNPARKIRDLI